MGACARNMQSDSAEIKPAQCCIKLVFHLTYTMMHGSTKLKVNKKLGEFSYVCDNIIFIILCYIYFSHKTQLGASLKKCLRISVEALHLRQWKLFLLCPHYFVPLFHICFKNCTSNIIMISTNTTRDNMAHTFVNGFKEGEDDQF